MPLGVAGVRLRVRGSRTGADTSGQSLSSFRAMFEASEDRLLFSGGGAALAGFQLPLAPYGGPVTLRQAPAVPGSNGGSIDFTYGNNGLAGLTFRHDAGFGSDVVFTPLVDGEALIFGEYEDRSGPSYALARLTADGKHDTRYGDHGVIKLTQDPSGARNTVPQFEPLSDGSFILSSPAGVVHVLAYDGGCTILKLAGPYAPANADVDADLATGVSLDNFQLAGR